MDRCKDNSIRNARSFHRLRAMFEARSSSPKPQNARRENSCKVSTFRVGEDSVDSKLRDKLTLQQNSTPNISQLSMIEVEEKAIQSSSQAHHNDKSKSEAISIPTSKKKEENLTFSSILHSLSEMKNEIDMRRLSIDNEVEESISLLFVQQCEESGESFNWNNEMERINQIDLNRLDAPIEEEESGEKTQFRWQRRGAIKKMLNFDSSNIGGPCNSELPWKSRVRESAHSHIVNKMSKDEIKLFENIYEVMTSEFTYLQELSSLKDFAASPQASLLAREQHTAVFCEINILYDISHSLTRRLSQSFSRDLFMRTLFEELSNFFINKRFEPYIHFLVNHNKRSLIVSSQPALREVSSKFLTPMQRITRYPLCLHNIMDRIKKLIASAHNPTTEDGRVASFTRNCLAYSSMGSVQMPKMTLLLEDVKSCFKVAKSFANRCNQAMLVEDNLKALAAFNASLSDEVPGLVHASHEILFEANLFAFSISKNELESIRQSKVIHNKTVASKGSLKKCSHRLLILNLLMILAKEAPSARFKFVLVDYVQHDQVEYFTDVQFEKHAFMQFHGMVFLLQFNTSQECSRYRKIIHNIQTKESAKSLSSSNEELLESPSIQH